MRNRNRDNSGLKRLLLSHFLRYLLCILLIICVWVFVTIRGWENFNKAIQPREMDRLEEQLIKGNYDSNYFKPYNSYGTFFEIVSYKNGLIYSSDSSRQYHFSSDELDLILPHDADYYYTSMEYISPESGKERYLIQKNKQSGNRYVSGALPVEEEEFAYLLDDKLTIISSNEPTERKLFSKRDIAIMTQTFEEDYHLYRYDFEKKTGEKAAFIIFRTYDVGQRQRALYNHIIKNMFGLIVILASISILSTWRLYRKISHPLGTLKQAISQLLNREQRIDYDYSLAPKELVSIFETFNKVSMDLKKSEQAREELEEGRQKLLANISHDLRTPITVIQGYSKALLDRLILGEAREQYLTIIHQKSIILNDLISSLYDFSRIQHPDFQLNMTRKNLSEYLRHYWARHYDECHVLGYQLEIDIPEGRYDVYLDQVQFERVLDNLLNNFIKYNAKGTTLFFQMKVRHKEVILTMADDGVVIPETIAKSLFNPFVTGSESRTAGKGGTGLGLSIVQQFVEMHGGTVTLVTDLPKYTKAFVIYLALAE